LEACGDEEEADVQTAIATVSLSGTLNEKLEAIAKAQFRGVEIFENDLLPCTPFPGPASPGSDGRRPARGPAHARPTDG
jgi:hypothetical protein